MRRSVVFLLLLAILLMAASCSPRVKSIAELNPIRVAPGAVFDGSVLPKEVNVTYTNGKTGIAQIDWKAEFPMGVEENTELIGLVQGTNLTVSLRLIIDEQLDEWADPPLPRLSAEELSSKDVATTMLNRAVGDRQDRETAFSWSPGGDTLAYVTLRSLYLWQVGDPAPMRVEAVGDAGTGGLNHPKWSFDGQYLSVQVNMTSEGGLLVLDPSRATLLYQLHTYGLCFWEPNSHSILITVSSGIITSMAGLNSEFATDLALFDTDTGTQRVLLKADSKTLYSAAGWEAGGKALYNCRTEESYKENLTLEVGD